jgi:hypothetical protein
VVRWCRREAAQNVCFVVTQGEIVSAHPSCSRQRERGAPFVNAYARRGEMSLLIDQPPGASFRKTASKKPSKPADAGLGAAARSYGD